MVHRNPQGQGGPVVSATPDTPHPAHQLPGPVSVTLTCLRLLGQPLTYALFCLVVGFWAIGRAFTLSLRLLALVALSPFRLAVALTSVLKKIRSPVGRLPRPPSITLLLPHPKLPPFHPPSLRLGLRLPSLKITLIVASLAATAAAAFSFWVIFLKDLPAPTALTAKQPPLTTRIFDRKGRLLFKIYRNENRTLVPLSEIPPSLQEATIAIEDKDFYQHRGLDFKGIIRALWQNLTTGTLTGGSTITQQLVKNVLLTPEKTWQRKVKEAILAVQVEFTYPKDKILEMYLNQVPYGGATYGVAEASDQYFGRRVQDLDLAQSAFLAGLPASPTEFSPFGADPALAFDRQHEVLNQMHDDGYITLPQEKQALAEKLHLLPPNIPILAPHFVMYVKQLLTQEYGDAMVEQGGLQVYTSLDLDLQDMAQKIVTSQVDKVRFLHITNGAALITKPSTGEILAMVGSRDYFDTSADGNVNATLALRQPGSSIKPVMYSVALQDGFTPATIIPDTPITFSIPGQPPYTPVNYDGKFHGNVTLRTALASSFNVPAVKVLAAIGLPRMLAQGQKLGITTWNDPSRFGLSLTLGGGEVRMVDMAVAYGTFANLGLKSNLHPILRVTDSQGHTLENYPCTDAILPPPSPTSKFAALLAQNTQETGPSCQKDPVLDPRVAYLLSDILSDNGARTPAFGPHSDLVIPNHQVAVKTGTTNNMKDNWTIGYTPDYLVAAWVGNFDGSPMSYVASGVTGASPIWNDIMTQLLQNQPDHPFNLPANLDQKEICTLTDTLACDACPTKKTEYFLPGTAPTQACTDDQIKLLSPQKSPSPGLPPAGP